MTADATFRASVRRDALAAGMPSDLADFLARHIGKDTARVLAGDERNSALQARARAPAGDRLARMCTIYPGASAVAGELRAAGTPLRTAAGMLGAVADSHGNISTAGAESIRLRIMQAQMRKGTQQ